MISFSGCIIQASGEIEYNKSFRIRTSKACTFEGDEKLLNGFLRTKMKNKGYHGSWKRYGSWTFFEDDTDTPSYLYAWGYSKGKHVHENDYVMKTEPIKLFDDLLLMRLRTPSLKVELSDTLPISNDIVTEWLKCICISKKTVPITTTSVDIHQGKHNHTEEVIFEIDDDELMNGSAQKLMKIDIPTANDSDNDDNNSDDELPTVQDATIDGSDKEVSDDEVSDLEDDTLFDDDMDEDDVDIGAPEEDDDEEDENEDAVQIGENQMLQYEPYEYDEHDNIPCALPQYISPWV